jgi:molybdopterin-guanine dinucleotide biosynthesis protein A
VLAGGAARRFGSDKALHRLDGETLAERARRMLAAVCVEVVIADGGRGVVPGAQSALDGPGRGPAAGILGAAAARPGHPLLVLACDLPGVTAELLARLLAIEGDWVAPRVAGRIEPLCALYRPPALRALRGLVERGELAPHRLAKVAGLSVGYLEGAELSDLGDPARLFWNVNTPDDLRE